MSSWIHTRTERSFIPHVRATARYLWALIFPCPNPQQDVRGRALTPRERAKW
jgi:hypothetical protein